MGVGGVCGCGGVYSGVKIENIQSAKICLNFNFQGRGQYCGVKTENTQSAKICLNFNFRRGGGALWSEIPQRGSLENLDTNLLFEVSVQKPACASQIVSHKLRMWRLITEVYCLIPKITVQLHMLS